MEKTGRILGLDFGQVRIGVALSDELGLTAQPLVTIPNHGPKTLNEIAVLARTHEVQRIVIGLPRNMNNTEGPSALAARAFGESVAAVAAGVPIEFIDERLTTSAAHRILSQTDMSGAKKRAVVDKLAAALILQTYLDRRRP